MPKQLLLGTRNPARIEMVQHILRNSGVEVLTLAELGIRQEVEEDGASTQANAEKKARFYYAQSCIPTLAVDGGLRIERFPPEKQPGVLVKRAPGLRAGATDQEVLAYYIQALKAVGGESLGTWTGSQAIAVSAQQIIAGTFTFVVQFSMHPRGAVAPGRALDSLMIDPASGKYYTELSLEERPYYQETRRFILESIERIAG